ncbi:MAG: hypothetical protein L0216_16605 [Planctomycetales bacterium]|nr:hypothetical protein [Planctomycetales bacterium]
MRVAFLIAGTIVALGLACEEREEPFAPASPGSAGPAPIPPGATTTPVKAFTKTATLAALAASTNPRGLAIAPAGLAAGSFTLAAGDVLVAAAGTNAVLRVDALGNVTTFAADSSLQDSAGNALATGLLASPQDVAVDSSGRAWVATASGTNGNGGTGNVVVLDRNGRVILQGSTLAVVAAAGFSSPRSVEWNLGSAGSDRLFVTNAGSGVVHRISVNASALASSAVAAIATGVTGVQSAAHDPATDALWLTASGTGLDELRRVGSASTVATGDNDVLVVATASGVLSGARGADVNSAGNVLVANQATGDVVEISAAGALVGALVTGLAAGSLEGLVVDRAVSRIYATETATPALVALTPPSFGNDVQAIFSARCTGCHAGAFAPFGLDLTTGNSRGNLVNVQSGQVAPDLCVRPGNSATGAGGSYLVEKVKLASPRQGLQMPRFGTPLTAAQIRLIEGWVDWGAPNN